MGKLPTSTTLIASTTVPISGNTVLADYRVLQDRKSTLTAGGPALNLAVTLPAGSNPFIDVFDGAGTDSPAHHPVLAFVLDTVEPHNLRCEVTTTKGAVGSTPQVQFTGIFNRDGYHSVHEVIDSDALNPGTNTISFKIVSGSGSLGIGGVVLWFKRHISGAVTGEE
ncbi:MAG: hypothetical protein ABR608_02555 [Pseudonocardiaceae bacterium]